MEKNIMPCFFKKNAECVVKSLFLIFTIFFTCSAWAKEIGKFEHAGKEGMQNIERTFKTRVKYCLMFIENVWEVEYFCI